MDIIGVEKTAYFADEKLSAHITGDPLHNLTE